MPVDSHLLQIPLIIGLAFLALISANLLMLATARRRLPSRSVDLDPLDADTLPRVLVQLPLYNEGELVHRVMAAVRAIDWPRDRIQVQVLDDSTDGSDQHSRVAVAAAQAAGLSVTLLRRSERIGFKAGALAAGLEQCDAEFVAIFDADFMPKPNFLRRTVAVLVVDSGLAFCQARWGHANRQANLLTRAQARLLDAHFRVEQEARYRLALPFGFNGTCGVWRRRAIDDAGGWQGDTLTEDLDLSLRAQLGGWRAAYRDEIEVPGSLPESARAWRAQQFRWTKGFVQCARKLLPRVWASSELRWWQKPLVAIQMLQPLAFLVGMCCTLLGLPYVAGAVVPGPVLTVVALTASLLGMVGTLSFLMSGVVPSTRGCALRESTSALFLTTGLLLSNARAGFQALRGHQSEFVRTPKTSAVGRPRGHGGLLELAAGLGLLTFTLLERPGSVPYLTMVIGGLLIFGWLQLLDGRPSLPKLLRAGR